MDEARERTRVRHGPLRPGELAEVAVLGDLALALEVIGWFAPFGGAIQALAIIPFSVLSARHRLRAGVIAMVGAATIAFLLGGVGIVLQTGLAGTVGLSIGCTFRRRWPPALAVVTTVLCAGVPLAAVTDFIDAISPQFRKLSFAQVRIIWRAARRALQSAGFGAAAARGDTVLNWFISHWWFTIPAAELIGVSAISLLCLRVRPFLAALSKSSLEPFTGGLAEREGEAGAAPVVVAPVPARFHDVAYRYASSDTDALRGVDLEVREGRLLALVGANGSGKSTLVRILAGRLLPAGGTIERPGRAGLGERGGTAMVFQRPESQVLGVRVRDDLCWGLPLAEHPDVAGLLARVGLSGFEDRETATLSGGQLQRLAIASALARDPRLLISDEATAMIDADGRAEVMSLLRELADSGLAVVHVTHRMAEAAEADVIVELTGGRVERVSVGAQVAEVAASIQERSSALDARLAASDTSLRSRTNGSGRTRGPSLVMLRRVGYVYAEGTPWAHRALADVDLDIAEGEGLVVTGANGSGKTTLAWILGGLMAPTEGEARMSSEPIDTVPRRVGVAFQHARLQLLRPTVAADVALGGDQRVADAALRSVALPPSLMGPRKVDDLSGGEQRRVALAGLLVRRPDLLVLDEPYAGLDDEARRALAHVLRGLRNDHGIATVVVSHDLDNVDVLGDRLVALDQGRLTSDAVIAS